MAFHAAPLFFGKRLEKFSMTELYGPNQMQIKGWHQQASPRPFLWLGDSAGQMKRQRMNAVTGR
jgi:hypothetical protein